MRIKLAALSALLGGIGAGALTFVPSDAEATGYRKIHASACYATPSSSVTSAVPLVQTPGTYGAWVSADTDFVCPYQSDNTLPHNDVDQVTVFGYRSWNYSGDLDLWTYAMVCRTFSTTDGGSCGTSVVTGSTGNFSLEPPVSNWNSTSTGFPYIYVHLEGSSEALRGISIDDDD